MPDEATDLVDLSDSLPEPGRYPFQLRTVFTGEVLKKISLVRLDCSTGVDQILVKYVKQVCDFLTGPLAHIINMRISNSQFPSIWKTARISKVHNPKQDTDSSTILMNNLYYSRASRASEKDSPPQLFCSVFGTILFGP